MPKRNNDELRIQIAKRLKQVVGKTNNREFADKLGNIVDASTIWTYTNGVSIPGPEVLIKISEVTKCSIDYILHGVQHFDVDNDIELDMIKLLRRAEMADPRLVNEIKKYILMRLEILEDPWGRESCG